LCEHLHTRKKSALLTSTVTCFNLILHMTLFSDFHSYMYDVLLY